MLDYLKDQEFLEQLYNYKNKITYIKIIAYDIDKRPMEELQGQVLEGNINIDGNSNVRRTCNLTMIALDQNVIIHDSFWGLSTQFQLFIGLKNDINYLYTEPIIWFPMGWYLISSFSVTEGINNKKINIQGKDKMCALNGELGGNFTNISTVLNKKDILSEDQTHVERTIDLTLDEIIKNLLVIYGGEDEYNIILKDLDHASPKELLTYNGEKPLYIYLEETQDETGKKVLIPYKATLDNTEVVTTKNGNNDITIDDDSIIYNKSGDVLDKTDPTSFKAYKNNIEITMQLACILPGQIAGYRYTNLIYPGELIANANESITSILDKIKNLFGSFEYFYNLEGQFVFQKKFFIKNEFNIGIGQEVSLEPDVSNNKYQSIKYNFANYQNFIQLNNTHQITNIKNDYAIWGKKQEVPICLRISLDNKPLQYISYDNISYSANTYDWREIIYQMAIDNHKNGLKNDFRQKLIEHNPQMTNGKTGYEQYYTDLQSYWRELYDPTPEEKYKNIINPNVLKDNQAIHIDQFQQISNKIINQSYDKNMIYIYDETNRCLKKYIDTLNFKSLYYTVTDQCFTNNAPDNTTIKHITPDHMYYYYNKDLIPIINSIKFEDKNIWVQVNEDEWKSLYSSLNSSEKDRIYYTSSQYKKNYKKVRDYHNIKNYFISNIDIVNNQFYLKNTETNEGNWLNEIWLEKNNKTICLWQNTGEVIDEQTIDMLIEAIVNHGSYLKYVPVGGEAAIFNNKTNIICLFGEKRLEGTEFLWYKTTASENNNDSSETYLSLINYKLNSNFNDLVYGKYNVRFKTKDGLIDPLSLIKIDKMKIYEYDPTGSEPPSLIVNKYHFPIGVYYLQTNNKIQINTSNYGQSLPKEAYYDTDNQYKGSITILQYNFFGELLEDTLLYSVKYYKQYYEYYLVDDGDVKKYWNKTIFNDFNKAQYWLDFIDSNYDFTKYNIKRIGQKQKVINNNQAVGLTFQDNFKIYYTIDKNKKKSDELYITQELYNYFIPSFQSISCLDLFNNLINTNLKIIKTVSFSIIPYYDLEVNDIIRLNSNNKETNGNYLISKITIPLKHDGLMQIQAQKIGGE